MEHMVCESGSEAASACPYQTKLETPDAMLQEFQAQLASEKQARDEWEERHSTEVQELQSYLEATIRQCVQEEFQDLSTKHAQEVLARINDIAAQDAKLEELRKQVDSEKQARHDWEGRHNTERQAVREHLESICKQQDSQSKWFEELLSLQHEIVSQAETVQEIRTQLDNEQQARDTFQQRLTKEMEHLTETLQSIFRQHVQVIVEKVTTLQDSADAAQSIEQFVRQSLNARLMDLEHRCSSLETRLMESINIKVDQSDKISREFEKLKLEKIYDPCQAQDLFERVCHLEARFHQDLLSREKEKREKEQQEEKEQLPCDELVMREEQLRRLSQGLSNEQAKQLADIERKFAVYHNPDSARQEGSVSSAVGEGPKLFDQQVVSAIVSEIVGELDKASEAYMQEVENAELGATVQNGQAKTLSETSTRGGSVAESSARSSVTHTLTNRSVAHAPSAAARSTRRVYSPALCPEATLLRMDSTASARGRMPPSPIRLGGGQALPQSRGFGGGSAMQQSGSAVLIHHLEGKTAPVAQAPPPRSGSTSPTVVRVLSTPYHVLSPRPYAAQTDRSEASHSPHRATATCSRQRSRGAHSGGATPPLVQSTSRTPSTGSCSMQAVSYGSSVVTIARQGSIEPNRA